jgi:hypothetical protein
MTLTPPLGPLLGVLHEGEGYSFTNARDLDSTPRSISSLALPEGYSRPG